MSTNRVLYGWDKVLDCSRMLFLYVPKFDLLLVVFSRVNIDGGAFNNPSAGSYLLKQLVIIWSKALNAKRIQKIP